MAGKVADSVLIDTSLLIEHFRKTRKSETLLYRLSQDKSFSVSVVTVFEFMTGLADSRRDYAASLFADMHVLAFDLPCATAAADLARNLRAANQLIAPPDLFIAATAISHQIPLATLNTRHFDRVTGLTVIGP